MLVVFDLDNTLVDRDMAFQRSLDRLFREYPPTPTKRQYQHILRIDRSGRNSRKELLEYLAQNFVQLPRNPEIIWNLLSRLATEITPVPAIHKMLQRLAKEYTLCLISNGSSSMQRTKLEHSDLGKFFELILISGEHGISKPDSRLFKMAIRHFRIGRSKTVMIGDDLERDIKPARRLGIKTIWVKGKPKVWHSKYCPSKELGWTQDQNHRMIESVTDVEETISQCLI